MTSVSHFSPSCLTAPTYNLISLAHRLIADLISHAGYNLISEPQRFVFITANSVVTHLNLPNPSTDLQIFFPENCVYMHVCVCVCEGGLVYAYICTFCSTRKVDDFFCCCFFKCGRTGCGESSSLVAVP